MQSSQHGGKKMPKKGGMQPREAEDLQRLRPFPAQRKPQQDECFSLTLASTNPSVRELKVPL